MRDREFKRHLLVDAVIIGTVSGLLSVAYRFALSHADDFREQVFGDLNILRIAFILAMFALFAVAIDKLLAWAPYSGGSGIPQIEAELRGKIRMDVGPTLFSKFFGGTLASTAGLALGREGPSIQLGGLAGKGLSRLIRRNLYEEKYMITIGASAGLAAAFNAPLAGVLFAIEEIHHEFRRFMLIPVIIATLIANFISYQLLGAEPAFIFNINQPLTTEYIWLAVIIGCLGGLTGVLFNKGLMASKHWMGRLPLPRVWKLFGVMVVGLMLAPISTLLLGGGHPLIEVLADTRLSLAMLALVLILRLVFTWLSYGTGAQGGIFLPVLAIGALVGALTMEVFSPWLPDIFYTNLMYIGIVAVLSAVIRAPLLSIILVTEMSGSMQRLLSLSTAAVVAYLVAELCQNPPIYHSLYGHLLEEEAEKKAPKGA